MRVSRFLFAPLLVLAIVSSLRAAPVELVLQQGLNGYAGVADTYVSDAEWAPVQQFTVNYGQSPKLMTSGGDDHPLLRFDLSAIPSHSVILSATLELYLTTNANGFARSMETCRVLKPWSEGNQNGSPITAPGRFGTTGQYAVQYHADEGVSVPWSALGLAAGSDYAPESGSRISVLAGGWTAWDVTAMTRLWVRGAAPNHGLVIRDLSGYLHGDPGLRNFHSSQFGTVALRPRLRVVYNPYTPFASAGEDIVDHAWQPDQGVTIDGSGSHDHPEGNNATLAYAWRLTRAAYGSNYAAGSIVSTNPAFSFTPDIAGDYFFELTVTNAQNEISRDTLKLRVWRPIGPHPRIYLTPDRIATLRARATPDNLRWVQVLNNANDADGFLRNKALAWIVTQNPAHAQAAITQALGVLANTSNGSSTKAAELALVYDWCHSEFTDEQRATFLAWFDGWLAVETKQYDEPGWGNYWPRWNLSWTLTGLALWGEHPKALMALEKFRDQRWVAIDVPLHDRIAEGGHWPEGPVYDWIANHPKIMAIHAWKLATGENLFRSTDWFRQRFPTLLLQTWPGVATQWNRPYRLYPALGDAERNRHASHNYGRAGALVLLEEFPDEPIGHQVQSLVAGIGSDTALAHVMLEEFMFFDPARASTPPSLKTHYAVGTGHLFMRSGWPTGGADTDRKLTHLTFQSGDHFSYHQHFDQNSFTLFKGGDLLIDSGVYSGEGTSHHDIDYYVRTIAHNTLVVRNPAEDFSSARDHAQSNDGGQRTFSPFSRSPTTIDYFNTNYHAYQRGKITRFTDTPAYTYAVGDATRAYNSPLYNQAQDTPLVGNVAKVTRFVREFLYLRDPDLPGASTDEKLVLVDRVGVTRPEFSGAATKLLFHTLNEPTVVGAPQQISPGETLYADGALAETSADDGHLVMQFLHPQQRNVRKVGGRLVKNFWVFDRNVDWHWNAGEGVPMSVPTSSEPSVPTGPAVRPTSEFEPQPYGEWRLELEPVGNALDHVFLTVLHPRLKTDPAVRLATTIHGLGVIGARIPRTVRDEIVLFSAAHDGAAPAGQIAFPLELDRPAKLRFFNLAAGARYTLDHQDDTIVLTPDAQGPLVVDAQGVLETDAQTPAQLAITDLALTADQRLRFTVTGPPGLDFVIERSTDLQTWTPVREAVLPASGYSFTEEQAANDARRFYRARQVP